MKGCARLRLLVRRVYLKRTLGAWLMEDEASTVTRIAMGFLAKAGRSRERFSYQDMNTWLFHGWHDIAPPESVFGDINWLESSCF